MFYRNFIIRPFDSQTIVTRLQLSCKWRELCRTSLMINCMLAKQTGNNKSVHMFALAPTFSEILKFYVLPLKGTLKSLGVILEIESFVSKYRNQNYKSHSAHFCASSYRFRDINILKLWSSKKLIKVAKYSISYDKFDGKCQNLPKNSHIFALALTVSVVLLFLFLTSNKVGQSHGLKLQFSQNWFNSTLKTRMYR